MNYLRLSFALIAAAFTAQAFAQTTGNTKRPLAENKTAAASELRLIAEAGYFYDGTMFMPRDSETFSYSGIRGGDPEHTLKYDSAAIYSNNSTVIGSQQKYFQTFDGNNNILINSLKFLDATTDTFGNNEQYLYTYDGNNNMLTYAQQSWGLDNNWHNVNKNIYTYGANNNELTMILQTTDASGNWFNQDKNIYFYTATNKIDTDIVQIWNSTTNTWDASGRIIYTYNIYDNLSMTVSQGWNSFTNTWINNTRNVFTYDASNNQLSNTYTLWNSTTNSWINYQKTINSNFANNMPQTVEKQVWNSNTNVFVNTKKYNYTYNSYAQTIYEYTQTWNTSGLYEITTSDNASKCYYETYTTDVKNVTTTGGTANIYPVPANDMLHVDLTWDEAQAFTVSICSVTGAVVKEWNEACAAKYNTSFSLSNIAPGTYFIKIQGEKGKVVKQLIVAR